MATPKAARCSCFRLETIVIVDHRPDIRIDKTAFLQFFTGEICSTLDTLQAAL
jgi:hypothetical protein